MSVYSGADVSFYQANAQFPISISVSLFSAACVRATMLICVASTSCKNLFVYKNLKTVPLGVLLYNADMRTHLSGANEMYC